jgi:hypothetical protein
VLGRCSDRLDFAAGAGPSGTVMFEEIFASFCMVAESSIAAAVLRTALGCVATNSEGSVTECAGQDGKSRRRHPPVKLSTNATELSLSQG